MLRADPLGGRSGELVRLEGVGSNPPVSRPPLVAALAVSVRPPHPPCRGGVGPGHTAEWAHFVAFGSSPTSRAAPRPSESRGRSVAARGDCRALCRVAGRPVPARALPARDESPRIARPRRLGRRRLTDAVVLVFAFAALLGSHARSMGPRWMPCCQPSHALPRTLLRQTRHLDDREPGDSPQPLFAGVLVSVADVGWSSPSAPPAPPGRSVSRAGQRRRRHRPGGRPAAEGGVRASRCGISNHRASLEGTGLSSP